MQTKNRIILVLYFVAIYISQFEYVGFLELLIISIWVWEVKEFLYRVGKSLPIINAIIIASILQWLIAPMIIYEFFNTEFLLFPMGVDREIYLKIATPLALTFALGLKSYEINNFDVNGIFNKIKISKQLNTKLGLTFMLIGIIAFITSPYVPISLAFPLYLLSNLLFISVIFLYYSSYSLKWYIIGFIILFLIYKIITTTMFGESIAWFFFLFLFFLLNYNFSIQIKIGAFVICILMISVVQIIKTDFRGTLSNDYGIDRSAEFKRAVQYNVEMADFRNKIFYLPSVERINQGAIISYIFKHVPSTESFAKGETIENAFISTIVPRFLDENKQTSGGRANFTRFTGKPLVGQTSMDLSILGEVYANYGLSVFSLVIIFIIGFLHRYVFNVVLNMSKKSPHLLFIIPIVFLQLIKAESDIFTNVNFLVKGLIFVVMIKYIFLNKLKTGA